MKSDGSALSSLYIYTRSMNRSLRSCGTTQIQATDGEMSFPRILNPSHHPKITHASQKAAHPPKPSHCAGTVSQNDSLDFAAATETNTCNVIRRSKPYVAFPPPSPLSDKIPFQEPSPRDLISYPFSLYILERVKFARKTEGGRRRSR